jgi:flagellar basal-body rod protein FlgG
MNTGNAMDLAIEGDGFFQIQKPTGETVYTRDGGFKLDKDGNIVTNQGDQLLPNIQVPIDAINVTILPDGTVTAMQQGTSTTLNLGQIDLARFANPAGLQGLGSNLFAPTDASGDPETGTAGENGFGEISQGFLEGSNVNVAEELVQMILAQRAFETNSRVIRAGDEMLRQVAGLSG